LLNPHGKAEEEDKSDTITRAVDLPIEKINPEIAGMAKEILSPYNASELMHKCYEAACIYRFAIDVLEKLEAQGKVAQLPPEPTDPWDRFQIRRAKQRQIFGIHEGRREPWRRKDHWANIRTLIHAF